MGGEKASREQTQEIAIHRPLVHLVNDQMRVIVETLRMMCHETYQITRGDEVYACLVSVISHTMTHTHAYFVPYLASQAFHQARSGDTARLGDHHTTSNNNEEVTKRG